MTRDLLRIDHRALAIGLSAFRDWIEREHVTVQMIDGHVDPGFVTVGFGDGSRWAFCSGSSDPHEAEALFELAAAQMFALAE